MDEKVEWFVATASKAKRLSDARELADERLSSGAQEILLEAFGVTALPINATASVSNPGR